MTDAAFNIESYLSRIGHHEPCRPTLETLAALHLKHPQAIAFENLDPFLGQTVDLSPGAVAEKLLGGRRGGYCFEHNLVFLRALQALGFAVTPLAARVLWGRQDDFVGPRSHMLLAVDLEGRSHIVDVGFGGLTQTGPLLLEDGLEQDTPHEKFRITRPDEDYRMQAHVGGEWRTLYRFDLQRQFEVDYVAASYFLSTSPASHFVTSLIAARALPDRRYALFNNRLSIHHRGGRSEQRHLVSAGEIARTFDELLQVDIPDTARFEAAVRAKNILEN